MSVWTVIVMDEDYEGYFAHKMYGPPDRKPAWESAQSAWKRPIAMIRGDFVNCVVTENNKERK